MPEEPIDILVKRFQSGVDQEESFRQIFALYHPRIMRFFQRKGFSSDESRDLAQECFFRIYKGLPAFRRESHFARWALEVSKHVLFNELRRIKTEKRDGIELSLDFEVSASHPEPLERAINQEQLQALRSALQKLPEQMRLCCKLRYEDGLKYQEIATVMRISIEMVKMHLHQGRKRLQEELGEAED